MLSIRLRPRAPPVALVNCHLSLLNDDCAAVLVLCVSGKFLFLLGIRVPAPVAMRIVANSRLAGTADRATRHVNVGSAQPLTLGRRGRLSAPSLDLSPRLTLRWAGHGCKLPHSTPNSCAVDPQVVSGPAQLRRPVTRRMQGLHKRRLHAAAVQGRDGRIGGAAFGSDLFAQQGG